MDIRQQIKKLTLEQKAMLLQGETVWTTYPIPSLDIPAIFVADGPHGLRKQAGSADHLGLNASIPATCFPTAATMANSWDLDLAEKLGKALGEEAAACDVAVVLGPGLNIKRSPLCGRNFEYFSEDPFLAGKMAAAYVKGIQEKGIGACPKHFAVNSQELRRMAMDAVVDERTMREIYLTGFEIAVKEGKAKTIMSSYNMINGTYANENQHLLTDILRKEWGFDGFVVTDWGADNCHTEGVRAGSNLVMPSPGADCALGLIKAVREGRIEESVLDERLEELLAVVLDTHRAVEQGAKSFDVDAHHALAKQCAEESIVLLDNDGILPLSKTAKVSIIGDFAKTPRYQGAGSSQVNPTKLDNLYDCVAALGVKIAGYAKGYDRKTPSPKMDLIRQASEVAKQGDVVLLCVGLEEILESEGMDRTHMELSQSQKELISAVFKANSNVVLVLSGGAPFVMPERESYRAAIHGYLGGQAGAGAMANALFGLANPCGKLSESWPLALEDTPCHRYFPSKERTSYYKEGLFVGYRYYDTAGVAVRYPFGYGLSYTQFAYSDLSVTDKGATFTVTNVGQVDGKEIAQLYISCQSDAVYRPKKELKGFAKVFLKAGESKTLTIPFDDKSFRYFSREKNAWEIEEADYQVQIAASVSDIQLSAELHVNGSVATENTPTCYKNADISDVCDADFEQILGRKMPDGSWRGNLTANDAFCQLYYARSIFFRLVYKCLTRAKNKAEKKGNPNLNILFIYNMPIRALTKMSGGLISEKMVEDILLMMNGRFWIGFVKAVIDFFRNLKARRKFKKALKS